MKSCIMLLTLELLSVQTPRGHRVSFLCGQQVQPEAPELWPPAGGPPAPLNPPQSVSPAGHQTICPATDLKGAQAPGPVQTRWLGGKTKGEEGEGRWQGSVGGRYGWWGGGGGGAVVALERCGRRRGGRGKVTREG